jgi:hypothetical protein
MLKPGKFPPKKYLSNIGLKWMKTEICISGRKMILSKPREKVSLWKSEFYSEIPGVKSCRNGNSG